MNNTNVDPKEISTFARLAAEWWDPQGKLKPLHDINPIRLRFMQQFIEFKDKKVLDVGCGGGILTESMAHKGAILTGIDLAEDVLQVAQKHAKKNNLHINYQQKNAETLAQETSASFDIITCMEMLEHVPNPSLVIKACALLLKPNGHVFFSTINRNLKSYLLAILGAEYILGLLDKGTHEYAKFIRPSELDGWTKDTGLELRNLSGITYNPFTKSYSLTKDVSVNYLAHYQAC